jgi:hypothetical protein
VLSFETLEERQPILDFLQARWRGIDGFRVRTQKKCQILELRLHGIAALDVWAKAFIDAGQLTHSPPHAAERRQRRLISFVEQRIRLGAEALELVRIRQDLLEGGQLLVFPAARCDSIDFLELE